MSDFDENIGQLGDALVEIETSIASTEEVSRTFRSEMEAVTRSMTTASQQASGLSRSIGGSLRSALDGLIFDGSKLSDVMRSLGRSVASKAFSSALTPVTNAIGSAVTNGVQGLVSGMLPFARGGVVSGGRVQAFAKGGVVNGPTSFPMRDGTGLMGEAGPEAIMPLERGADGKLGVRSSGGGAVYVTVNVSTPDAGSFQRSRSQIAAQLSRAVSRGQRNL